MDKFKTKIINKIKNKVMKVDKNMKKLLLQILIIMPCPPPNNNDDDILKHKSNT
jgi:hypothetical protein